MTENTANTALPFGDKLHYSMKDVETITTLSRSTLTKYEKNGLMPARIRLGVRKRYFVGHELQEWYQSRLTETRHTSVRHASVK